MDWPVTIFAGLVCAATFWAVAHTPYARQETLALWFAFTFDWLVYVSSWLHITGEKKGFGPVFGVTNKFLWQFDQLIVGLIAIGGSYYSYINGRGHVWWLWAVWSLCVLQEIIIDGYITYQWYAIEEMKNLLLWPWVGAVALMWLVGGKGVTDDIRSRFGGIRSVRGNLAHVQAKVMRRD